MDEYSVVGWSVHIQSDSFGDEWWTYESVVWLLVPGLRWLNRTPRSAQNRSEPPRAAQNPTRDAQNPIGATRNRSQPPGPLRTPLDPLRTQPEPLRTLLEPLRTPTGDVQNPHRTRSLQPRSHGGGRVGTHLSRFILALSV